MSSSSSKAQPIRTNRFRQLFRQDTNELDPRRAQILSEGLFWTALICVLGLSFATFITNAPIHSIDQLQIIDPLIGHGSVGHYFKTIAVEKSSHILRDLSLLVELYIEQQIAFKPFYLTNLLLWLAILAVLNAALKLDLSSPRTRYCLLFLVALAPAFTHSIAQVSGRGLLMSCLCILIATYKMQRMSSPTQERARHFYEALFFYLASLLCDYTFMAWPLWAIWYLNKTSKSQAKNFRLTALALVLLFTTLPIISASLSSPLFPLWEDTVFKDISELSSIFLLGFARNIFNTLCPTNLLPYASPSSIINVYALPLVALLPLTLRVSYKVPGAINWFLLFILTSTGSIILLPLTFAAPPLFLLPGIALLIYLGLILNHYVPYARFILLIAALIFAGKQMSEVQRWQDEKEFWRHTFLAETPVDALPALAEAAMKNDEPNLPVILSLQLQEKKPLHPDIPYLYSKAVYHDNVIHSRAKPRIIAKQQFNNPWSLYYQALSHHALAQNEAAYEVIYRAMRAAEGFNRGLEPITADAYYICQQAFRPNCKQLIDYAIAAQPEREWQQNIFEERLQEFGYGIPARSSREPE